MKLLKIIWLKIGTTIRIIIEQLLSINKYIVKSDEENLNELLKTEDDKRKFRDAIDELQNNESVKSKTVYINKRNITISI